MSNENHSKAFLTPASNETLSHIPKDSDRSEDSDHQSDEIIMEADEKITFESELEKLVNSIRLECPSSIDQNSQKKFNNKVSDPIAQSLKKLARIFDDRNSTPEAKLKALELFEKETRRIHGAWQLFGTLLGAVIGAGLGLIAGAVIGFAVGGILGSITGPGAFFTAVLGALTGGGAGAIAGLSAGAVIGGTIFGAIARYGIHPYSRTIDKQLKEFINQTKEIIKQDLPEKTILDKLKNFFTSCYENCGVEHVSDNEEWKKLR